jgi:hypothetical protein
VRSGAVMRWLLLLSVDWKVEVGVSKRAGLGLVRVGLLVGVREVDR